MSLPKFEDDNFCDQLIDKCYSSHLCRKFNLEQEGNGDFRLSTNKCRQIKQ